ncbi:MAG: hypothetical protein FIB08_00600 [Candidatus Methanoperedens sp.]|nr:hypothetical protein [Candidatus Methanoperedens sp.]
MSNDINYPEVIGTREDRGKAIAEKNGQIIRINDNLYKVKSQSSDTLYDVKYTEIGWKCTCPDHTTRGVQCKHIYAVEISFAIRKEVEVRKISPITISDCMFCGSANIVKDGLRHNKHGDIQKFYCNDCNQYFSFNIGFEKMKHNPQAVTTAMQLYFSGESLRNTQKSLEFIGVKVSHQTISNWIEKYSLLMKKYVDKLKPQVGDT